MTTIAISMVKDEADIVGYAIDRMLPEVDQIIVCDNGSTDGTLDILYDKPVTVVEDPDPAFYQSQKVSALAAMAARLGAEWVVPFDADEVWLSPHGRLADVLASFENESIITGPFYQHHPTALDPDREPDPTLRMAWRLPLANPLPKVACRPVLPVTITAGNHAASYPRPSTAFGAFEVHHFAHRSPEQFVRKVRNTAHGLALTDLPESVDFGKREQGRVLDAEGEEGIHRLYRERVWVEDPHAAGLVHHPAVKS